MELAARRGSRAALRAVLERILLRDFSPGILLRCAVSAVTDTSLQKEKMNLEKVK